MKSKLIPYITVFIQFLCLGILAFTGPLIAGHWPALLLQTAGGLLGLWAILVMKIGNFNITPTIVEKGKLVRGGPYKWIRHPMYSALLLFMLGMVLGRPTWFRWLIWLVLLIDLLVKLNFEEKQLQRHYAGYSDYQKRTRRLIPFIY